MVNASEEDAAAFIAFDEGERPQRPTQVQGSGEKLRDGFVEGFRIPRRRQDEAPNVRAQIERRIGLPIGTGSEGASIRYHALAKAVVSQEALLENGQHMLVLQRLPEDPEAVDHHRIGRIVHHKPSSIYAGHRLAPGHRNALRRLSELLHHAP